MAERQGHDPRPRRGDVGPPAGPPRRAPSARGTQQERSLRGWGSRPGRLGVFTVIGGAVLGSVATILVGSEPGRLLGAFVIGATLIAAFAVRPRAAYMIIPVPALAYVLAALPAGLVHDRAVDTSHTALVVNSVQWIASGFFAMATATAAAIVVAAARMLANSRLPRNPRGSGRGGKGRSMRGRGTRGLPAAGRPGSDSSEMSTISTAVSPRSPG